MTTFLALYHGDTVSSASLVATTADPSIVGAFAERMLANDEGATADKVLAELQEGRRRAMQLIQDTARSDSSSELG